MAHSGDAGQETRILMFHRVLPDVAVAYGLPCSYRIRGTSLTREELRETLDLAGPILPLDALERALAGGGAMPAGAVLTFDDGYREHLDVVAPLLAQRGVTATFFVATGLHGGSAAVAAVDAWYWLLDHARSPVATVPMPDGGSYVGRLDTLDGKAAWVCGLPKAALVAQSARGQRQMLEALAEAVRCDVPEDLAARLYLRPDEWGALARMQMRVGAHSVSHPRLTGLTREGLEAEVVASVEAVSAHSADVAFAYPDGDYDERVVDLVRSTGVSSAVTCEPGVVSAGADLMRLPRVFIATTPESSYPYGAHHR